MQTWRVSQWYTKSTRLPPLGDMRSEHISDRPSLQVNLAISVHSAESGIFVTNLRPVGFRVNMYYMRNENASEPELLAKQR